MRPAEPLAALAPNETYKITCDTDFDQRCFVANLPNGEQREYRGLAKVEATSMTSLSGSTQLNALWIETRPNGPNTGNGLVGGGGSPMLFSDALKTALYRVTTSTNQTSSFSAWQASLP
jgi:hypothetical protein